jgi:hypothetical protein
MIKETNDRKCKKHYLPQSVKTKSWNCSRLGANVVYDQFHSSQSAPDF